MWNDETIRAAEAFFERCGYRVSGYQLREIVEDLHHLPPKRGGLAGAAGAGPIWAPNTRVSGRAIATLLIGLLAGQSGLDTLEEQAAAFFGRHEAPPAIAEPSPAIDGTVLGELKSLAARQGGSAGSGAAAGLAPLIAVLEGDLSAESGLPEANTDDESKFVDRTGPAIGHTAEADRIPRLEPVPDHDDEDKRIEDLAARIEKTLLESKAFQALLRREIALALRTSAPGQQARSLEASLEGAGPGFPAAALEATASEAARLAARQLGPPLPELSAEAIEAIRRQAEAHPWAQRAADDPRSPFEWVRDHYGEWIPGLLRSHLRADSDLYRAFSQRVGRQGLPDWLDVPSEKEARLRQIDDPEQRRDQIAVSLWNTAKNRRHRARAPKP